MSTDILFWIGGALLGLIGLTLLTWALIGDRSKGRRRCPRCWYDMSKTEGVRCSECGREARSERKLFKSRRRWRWAMASVLLFALATYVAVQPKVKRHGWASVVPSTVVVCALQGPNPQWALTEFNRRTVTSPPMVLPLEINDEVFADWQWRVCIEGLVSLMHQRPSTSESLESLVLLDGIARASKDPEHVARIYSAFDEISLDADPILRIAAVTLAANNPDFEQATQRLSVSLLDDDPQVRLAALFALVRLPVAERWYNFPDQWDLVSRFRSQSPPTLDQYLERYDNMEFDRSRVETVGLALESVGVTSDDPELKAASLRFASALRGKHGLHYIYVERAIADEHDAVVAAGFIIARKLHPDSISPKMVALAIETLKSRSPRVREAASAFFPNIEPNLLIKHFDDLELISFQSEDQAVRWAVKESLRKLYPILDQMQAENRMTAP